MTRKYKSAEKVCSVCNKKYLGKGNQKTCSFDCRNKRLKGQLLSLKEKRRKNTYKVESTCLACNRQYNREHWRQKYCSSQCSEQGLNNAIQRQREKRRQESKEKKEAKAKA